MKSLLLTLASFLLLAQLVSGSWYVKKCANKMGNCRNTCRTGEMQIQPPTGMCSKEKRCCILSGKDLNPLICADNLKTTAAPHAAVTESGAPMTPEESAATTGNMVSMASVAATAPAAKSQATLAASATTAAASI